MYHAPNPCPVCCQLEAEVAELRGRLGLEVELQETTLERLGREKQEERNLAAMLRDDINQLHSHKYGEKV